VGGMLTSTFLTLYVVPVVYTMFSDLSKRVGGQSAEVEAELADDGK